MTYFTSTQAQIRQLETRNLVRKHNSEPTIYRRFAASKLSDRVKPNVVVEFVDITGRKHTIPVRSKRKREQAQEFLAILKKEKAEVNAILAEYPWTMGKVDPEFAIDCMLELYAYGLDTYSVSAIVGY